VPATWDNASTIHDGIQLEEVKRMVNRRDFLLALGAGTAVLAAKGSARAAQDPVQVAVITHAEGAHLDWYFRALAETAEVQSVVLADPSGSTLSDARNSLGDKLTATYESPELLFDRERPSLALISMEARSTPPAIEAALKANCHVMAEKPACVRIEDFTELAALADEKQRHLMLALANRLNPEVLLARRLIQEGKIGKIYGLEMHLVADQTRLTRPEYHASWFARKERAGGGHLIWLGIHWLDLAMFLTRARITHVSGFTGVVGGQPLEVEDSAALALQFDNGTFGTMTSGYYLDHGYHSHIKIWGSRGWLQIETHGGAPLTWYSQDEPEPKVQRLEQVDGPSGYVPFVQACVRAAIGLEEPPLTTADSLRALEVVFAGYRAAETGQRQTLR
jgi:UDP-N-acetyl-2-amino-2-deoxyglucuronate dehydrogenase